MRSHVRVIFAVLVFVGITPGLVAGALAADEPDWRTVVAAERDGFEQYRARVFALHGYYQDLLRDRGAAGDRGDLLKDIDPAHGPAVLAERFADELALARAIDDPDAWLALATRRLEAQALDEARRAAFGAYFLAGGDRSTVTYGAQPAAVEALRIMAEAHAGRNDLAAAIALYRRLVALEDRHQDRGRLAVLEARRDFKVERVTADGDRRLARACIVLSAPLRRPLPLPAADYLTVTPRVDAAVEAGPSALCVTGLDHGRRYQLALHAGLTAANGGVLDQDMTFTVTVPNRTPSIGFSAGAYVLPDAPDDGLPLRTVNVAAAQLALYRIDDRNLVSQFALDPPRESMSWYREGEIENTQGQAVWRGRVSVDGSANRERITILPVDEMLTRRQAGVYVLVAHGEAADEDDDRYWTRRVAQWFVISDLGLTVIDGGDGLNVLVRALSDAAPVPDTVLTLLARNNRVLGTVRADADGFARFAPGLARGVGGDRPALITAATARGDYVFIRLTGPYLDLSERGVEGRPAPGPLDAYLFTERGVYRPGETVQLSGLLRDRRSRAVADIPITFRVRRPDGRVVLEETVPGDLLGSYHLAVPLAAAARDGRWHAEALVDREATPVGRTAFVVEDFVPQRLEMDVRLAAAAILPDTPVGLQLDARFLYGAPAGHLRVRLDGTVMADPTPFPDHADYRFGLADDSIYPIQRKAIDGTTDARGRAAFTFALDRLPDTTVPLALRLVARVFDIGGRPVNQTLSVPVRDRDLYIGLRQAKPGDRQDDGPAIDIVTLDGAGEPVPGRALAYELVREHYDYQWYRQGESWRSHVTRRDEARDGGRIETDARGRAQLAFADGALPPGRYRLDVFDAAGATASGLRFALGWYHQPARPNIPDALELTLADDAVAAGGSVRAFVRAPFAGKAWVAVVNDRVHYSRAIDLPAAGLEVTIPVESAWGPGAYVMVTAFRPDAAKASPVPVRAMGFAWFAIDRASHAISVAFDVPRSVRPGEAVTIPLRFTGRDLAGTRLGLTVMAVDEGILQLTGFSSPDPRAHFLARRALGVEVRDLYGQLIRRADGANAVLRSGGDAALGNLAGNTVRTVDSIVLFERLRMVVGGGHDSVTLTMPDFNGALRLMIVAYGEQGVGAGDGRLVVRAPVVADILLPRFLAPDDRAEARLSLHNTTDRAVTLTPSVWVDGPLTWHADLPARLVLQPGQRHDQSLTLSATGIGTGAVSVRLNRTQGETLAKTRRIAIRPAWPLIGSRAVALLEPGARISFGRERFQPYRPGTGTAITSIATGFDFNMPGIIAQLEDYPYRCTEQTISRVLPFLPLASERRRAGSPEPGVIAPQRIDNAVRAAIRMVLARQRSDGGFAVWRSTGPFHPWLSVYAVDFLVRAEANGYPVSAPALQAAKEWLDGLLEGYYGKHLHARAYGLFLQARDGGGSAGRTRRFSAARGDALTSPLARYHLAAALRLQGAAPSAAAGLFTPAALSHSDGPGTARDYGSPVRDFAAIIATAGETGLDGFDPDRIAAALDKAYEPRRYFSPQELAWLGLATRRLGMEPGGALDITVDGSPYTGDGPYHMHTTDQDALPKTIVNRGQAAVRVATNLRGQPLAAPAPYADGVTISRQFYRPDGSPADLAAVDQNDVLLVVLEVDPLGDRLRHFLLADLLSAGLEIESTRLSGGPDARSFLGDLTSPVFAVARDDRFAAALDLDGEPARIAYQVRAVTPGVFTVPAPFVEDMYDPEVRALGTATSLIVRAR